MARALVQRLIAGYMNEDMLEQNFTSAILVICASSLHTNVNSMSENTPARSLTNLLRHCDKCFATSSGCKKHERVHTREKRYKCKHCDKFFSRLANCRRHELIRDRTTHKYVVKTERVSWLSTDKRRLLA